MPTVVFIDPHGERQTVEADPGQTVMEAAVGHDVPGVVGQCGGSLACASCHVYVQDPWSAQVGGPSEMEDDMLDGALAERRPESRLSCQLRVCAELDGLTVEVAPEQM